MSWQTEVWHWLLYAAISSCLLFAVAALAIFVTDQPVRRLRFIQWAFIGAILAPLLNQFGGTPQWHLGLLAGEPAPPAAADVAPRAPEPIEPQPAARHSAATQSKPRAANRKREFPTAVEPPSPRFEERRLAAIPQPAVQEIQPEASESPAALLNHVDSTGAAVKTRPGFDISSLLLLAYSGIACGVLVWSLLGLLRLLRLKHRSKPAGDEVASALLRIAGEDRLAQRVQVRISGAVPGPLTYGWRRPVIVLPEAVCRPGAENALAYCLAHEWDHVRRRDILPWHFATLLQAVFFFQPLFWWLRKQMRLCQDYLADAFAAQHATFPEDYAEFLVEQAHRCTRGYSAALGFAQSKTTLFRRVEMVLNDDKTLEPRCRKRWSAAVGCAAVAILAAVAAVRLDAGTPESEPAPPAAADAKEKPAQPPVAKRRAKPAKANRSKAVTYTGVVTDRISGKPIPDTKVIVRLTNSKPAKGKEDWSKTIIAKSDANGKYTFTIGPEEASQHYLYVEVDAHHPDYVAKGRSGYGHLMIRKNLKLGEPPFFSKIRLWPGKPVTGTVVSPDGKPQKGVEILTYSKHAKSGRWSFGGFYKTHTDDKGRFRFVASTPGEGVYWITPKGFAPQAHIIPEARGDVGDVVLQHGSVLNGKVLTAKGKPVPNVRVEARRSSDGEAVDQFLAQNAVANHIGRTGETNAKGEFTLDELPPGRYRLRVRSKRSGWAAKTLTDVFVRKTITLREGDQTAPIEFRAVPHVEIHVRFVDSKGKPTRSHRFHVFGQIDNSSYFAQSTRVDNKTGIAVVRVPHGLQRTTINLMTNEHGALRWRMKAGQPLQNKSRIELGTLESDHHDLEVVRFVAPILLVKAVDENGKPLKEFKPKAVYEKGKSPNAPGVRFINGVRGDVGFEKQPDGRWRSSQLFPDLKLTVIAEKSGFTTTPQTVTLKEGTTREVVFVMKDKSAKKKTPQPKTTATPAPLPRKIVGRVIDRLTGKPIRGATLDVDVQSEPTSGEKKSPQRSISVRTNADGEYHVELTPQETRNPKLTLAVRTSHSAYATRQRGFTASRIRRALKSPGTRVFNVLKLWPGKEIHGVVETPEGMPVADAEIITFARHTQAARHEFDGFHRAKTDKNGRFRFGVATPGDVGFFVYPKGFAVTGLLIPPQRGDLGQIVVQKGQRLKGRVLDARGKPLAGVNVGARKRRGESKLEQLLSENAIANLTVRGTRTNDRGEFELDDLPAGEYSVRIDLNRDSRTKPAKHVFLRRNVRLTLSGKPAELTLRAVPQVELQVKWVDGSGKPTQGREMFVQGRLDDQFWSGRIPAPNRKTGRATAHVPHGLQDAMLNPITLSRYSLRWRLGPKGKLRRGRIVPLGIIDDDRGGIQIVRYSAPVLTLKPVDENGKMIRGVTIQSAYALEKPPAKFGIRTPTGDVRFTEQNDGRWLSSRMLPDEPTTITVSKPGYAAKPLKITLKEGATRELAVVLKPASGK